MDHFKKLNKSERFFYLCSVFVVLLGIVIRIVVWLQNRNLIIDEANIARNLFERSFAGLTSPLSYEQYAPIFFLWMEKLFTVLFGFSEFALKAYPLISGIGVLVMLFLVLREFVPYRAIWYPLALFATAFFFIRYSTEVKQYMSDALIVLLVLWAAIKIKLEEVAPSRFTLYWILIGTVAIFSSMPSVFALTGVGGYYIWYCREKREFRRLAYLIPVFATWLAFFGIYYVLMLKDQAHSKYLQDYHANYFLVATPTTAQEFAHNWSVCSELVSLTTGYNRFSKLFNFSMLAFGAILLLRKDIRKGILVLFPLAFTLIASAVNEFSLIPRVALFMMPLFLVIIAYAVEYVMTLKVPALSYLLSGFLLILVFLQNDVKQLWQPWYNEEITRAMQHMKDNQVTHRQVNISHGSGPAFIYYTQIHPDRQRWITIQDAQIRSWEVDWRQVVKDTSGRIGVIFTTIGVSEASQHRGELLESARLISSIEDSTAKCYAYVLER